MATYASLDQLTEYLADSEADAPDDEAAERLLERAERRLDTLLGPHPRSPPGGLKVDPAALTDAQRDALGRACCACAEHELLVGLDFLAGSEDFASGDLVALRPPLRVPPRALEELAGSGLVRRSGCAAPSPPPPVDEFAPCAVFPWEL